MAVDGEVVSVRLWLLVLLVWIHKLMAAEVDF